MCRFRGLRLLRALMGNLPVQWNTSLVSLQPSKDNHEMHLIFEPGHLCHKVDVVIGADGANSMVRRLLVDNHPNAGPDPVLTQYVEEIALMMRIRSKDGTDKLQKLHPIQTMASDKDGLTTIAVHQWKVDPEERAHELIQMSRISVPPGDQPEDLNLTGDAARKFMLQSICNTPLQLLEPWKTYIEELREPYCQGNFKVQRVRGWTPMDYDNLGGMATLAGDAAHLMLPFGGRGLINTAVDANGLSWAIATMPRPGAIPITNRMDTQKRNLDAYDEGLRERAESQLRKTLEEAENSINQAAIREALEKDPGKAPVCIYQ
ncbi:hypothetical protein ACHAQH_000051 [Verticillium albo-atrum]